MMQVIAQSNNLQAELLEFLYGKIKQSAVIRFKAQVTALAQQLLVQCQEVAVRQTAFGMTSLRPGVAEIQIQLLDFAGLKPVQQVFGISTNDFNIRQLFVLRCLSGEIGNIMLCFIASSIHGFFLKRIVRPHIKIFSQLYIIQQISLTWEKNYKKAGSIITTLPA